MPSSRRCVFGCVTKGFTIHRFPNPAKHPEQFKTWVELGGEQLKNLSPEEVHLKKKVCDRHFIESHRNRNNRLNALAIPTLHLPHAVTSVQDEPDCCARSAGKPSVTKQVPGKLTMTKKMQGPRTKILNLPYYMKAERKIRSLQQEILRLRKRCKSYKSRLENAVKMSDSKVIIVVKGN